MAKDKILIPEAALTFQAKLLQSPNPVPSTISLWGETKTFLGIQYNQRIPTPVEIEGAKVFELNGRFWVTRFRGMAPLETDLGFDIETDRS